MKGRSKKALLALGPEELAAGFERARQEQIARLELMLRTAPPNVPKKILEQFKEELAKLKEEKK